MDFIDVSKIYGNYLASAVCKDVAPDDDMYHSGKEWYYSVGESGLQCVLQSLCFSKLGTVASILDLPCGHGRVARHLRAAFPEAQMSFCDLDASGVEFCAHRFNGRGIHSKPDLTAVALGGPYDVIWIGSLFTHLDFPTTKAWLGHLVTSLNEDGILVATLHGNWSIEVHEQHTPLIHNEGWNHVLKGYRESGYGYAPFDAGRPEWGMSLCSPARIVDFVSSLPGVRLLGYTERAWADNHDVLCIARTDRNKPWGKLKIPMNRQSTLTARNTLRQFLAPHKIIKRLLRKD